MRNDFQNWSFLATVALSYSGETTSMLQKASALFQALQFLAFLLRLLSHIRVNVMKFCVMWRLIQYNPPLEWTWSKKNFICAGECWMRLCGASAVPSSPQQHNTPSLGWHHLTCTQNTGAIKLPLFTMIMPWMPVTKAFVSNVQAAGKAEKDAQSLPALPSKPLLGEHRRHECAG